jgi:cytochrome c553
LKIALDHRKQIIALALASCTMLFTVTTSATTISRYNRASAVFPAGNAEHGKELGQSCLACHGDTDIALGQPPFHAPKLRYQRISTLFYALEDYRSGKRKSAFMNPLAKAMSDQDIRDLALYLSGRALGTTSPVRAEPAQRSSLAHQKNDELCSACHGEAGLGVMDGYPVLAGQHQDYLEYALNAYRSGARSNPTMATFAHSLKPNEVRLMAAYFAAQTALESVK